MTDHLVLGTNILQPLIDLFEAVLKALHGPIGSWGLSIIALTLIIRTILLPLAVVQYRSMKGMAALAPEIKKLQEKYPDDAQKVMQAQRELMSEHGVNPLMGCLPLLLQAPVFISLFYLLRTDLKVEICGPDLRAAGVDLTKLGDVACGDYTQGTGGPESFWFIPDLTDKATGSVLIILLVLYVGSQLLSTLLMPSTVTGLQRNIFYALPFLFVPFIISFPAGLLVYWITTNLFTVVQQVALRRIYGAPGVSTDESPIGLVEGAVLEVAEAAGKVKSPVPSERPQKRKRTGKRR